jgi:hypothetical protein
MRTVTPLLKMDTLKLIYIAYFHSIMSYGVYFWENSSDSKIVFNIQKKIIRIMAGVKTGVLNLWPAAPHHMAPLTYVYVTARGIPRVQQIGANAQALQFSITVFV